MNRKFRRLARHVRLVATIGGCSCIAALIAGCGPATKEPDETAMRASFQRKGPINIADVPPDKRAMVQALMDASKKGPPPPHLATKK